MAILFDDVTLRALDQSKIPNLSAQTVYIGSDRVPFNYLKTYSDFYVRGGETASTVDSGITVPNNFDMLIPNVKCIAGVPILIIFNCNLNMPNLISLRYSSKLSGTSDALVSIGKRTGQPFLLGGGLSAKTTVAPVTGVLHIGSKTNAQMPNLALDPDFTNLTTGVALASAFKAYVPGDPAAYSENYTIGAIVNIGEQSNQDTIVGPAFNIPVRIAFPYTPTVTETRDFNVNLMNATRRFVTNAAGTRSTLWAAKILNPTLKVIS
ncbi:hypothetical protein [Methylotenera sp.]|uniref:hypothetical protein n=1 Tax=Methylotenera sp. TaxID=2051956 RepID=UPI002488968D|nr:hypothetical protein [Methylotenera sp.]MDI1362502.1 hypothetical protein [Methylotenera sp.]